MNTPTIPSGAQQLNRKFNEIQQLIYKNEFPQALTAAEQLMALPAAKTAARSLVALAAAMAGDRDKALSALAELAEPATLKHAEVLVATGSAWFKLNEPAEAIRYLAAAVEADGNHMLANARLGACLLTIGRVKDALPYLEKACQLMPASGGAALNLARAYLAAGRPADAQAQLERSADAPDRDAELFQLTCAEALVALGHDEEAEKLLTGAAAGNNPQAIRMSISLLAGRGKHDQATSQLREALERFPEDAGLMDLAAELSQVRGRFGEAARWLRKALEKDAENALLWARLAMLSSRRLGEKEAQEAAGKALALTEDMVSGPPRAMALNAQAHVLNEQGDSARAEQFYRDALTAFPGCVPALNGLGHLLMQMGRVGEATEVFERLKKRAPLQGWSQLIHAREVPDDPKVLEQMALAARRPSLEGPVQSNLLFTLASAWEKKQDYDKSWEFVTEANAASKAHLDYRPEVHRQRVEREMARFSKAFMTSRCDWGSDSRVPVFVLGMPRSGTTLVEQILGSHSQVFGAGELSLVPELIQKLNAWEIKTGTRVRYPECIVDLGADESRRFAEKHLESLRGYAPEAQRIVDKLPHNFEHIGLIKLLFPNAAILHMKREPRDVAMSNYFVDYGAKFGGMGFAYDLTWIGEQLVDHQRLMDHWHQVFPGQILEVDYDALVEDVEGWARRIIDYLGLGWEPGVLSFQELDRAVKTASVWQVRQPIYTTSKEKWKRYAAFLEPLEAALAEVPPPPEPAPLPKIEPGLFLSAQALLEAAKPAEAEAAYRKLLQARPAHAAAHHFLGAALYQQGKLDEACREMRRSVELHRGHVQWLENLAACEAALGNTEAAQNLREIIARRKAGRGGEDIPGVMADGAGETMAAA